MQVPRAFAAGAQAKAHTRGTHRSRSPLETLRALQPSLQAMGITRVANVTGLDRIGIPVCMACRPNSRSLSVAQGKGLDLASAKASALMESVEGFHAENVRLPLQLGSQREMQRRLPLVDVDRLPRPPGSAYHSNLPLLWVEGLDLLRDEPAWVPFQLVHTNFHGTGPLRIEATSFLMSTNGLASGNHRLEALSHALCEIVERHSCHQFLALPPVEQQRRLLDLDSIDDEDARGLLARFRRAGVAVAVWDTSGPAGLPVFRCQIADAAPDPGWHHAPAGGYGCHPARAVALLRALTEATQSRLTAIAGSRDDILHEAYDPLPFAPPPGAGHRRFQDVPAGLNCGFEEDVAFELASLSRAGLDSAVALDLSLPGIDAAVVRVVVPGAAQPDHGLPARHAAPGGA